MREHLLTRDLIYVGGGSVISLLGAWRAHGIDAILREAWQHGVVLCGLSAGSLLVRRVGHRLSRAAHPSGGTGAAALEQLRSFRRRARALRGYRRMLAEGMPAGYAAEDGSALHFEGERLTRVVSSRSGARAHSMRCTGGRVSRRPCGPPIWAPQGPVRAGPEDGSRSWP